MLHGRIATSLEVHVNNLIPLSRLQTQSYSWWPRVNDFQFCQILMVPATIMSINMILMSHVRYTGTTGSQLPARLVIHDNHILKVAKWLLVIKLLKESERGQCQPSVVANTCKCRAKSYLHCFVFLWSCLSLSRNVEKRKNRVVLFPFPID